MTLTVPGVPGPKGSRNVGRNGGTYEQSKIAVQWTKDVAMMCQVLKLPKLNPPYQVAISFAMPTPDKATYAWPVRGDLDKLERATLDGLQQGGVIADDKHVVALASDKQFGVVTGAVIHIAGH